MNNLFKNSVLHDNVDTVKWLKKASIRAIKTIAQTMVAMITVGQTLGQVDWKTIVSVGLVSGVVSMLTSVAGIEEVEAE